MGESWIPDLQIRSLRCQPLSHTRLLTPSFLWIHVHYKYFDRGEAYYFCLFFWRLSSFEIHYIEHLLYWMIVLIKIWPSWVALSSIPAMTRQSHLLMIIPINIEKESNCSSIPTLGWKYVCCWGVRSPICIGVIFSYWGDEKHILSIKENNDFWKLFTFWTQLSKNNLKQLALKPKTSKPASKISRTLRRRGNLIPRFSLLPMERPWLGLVTFLPESGRLQTNDLGEERISVRFVSAEHTWKTVYLTLS